MEPAQTFRIFVSSPGDAQFERQRVDRVVARLSGELAGTALLTTVRWEREFYQAHSTFQSQIPASVDCNIVLAIFRARLGTELPPDFDPMPDGEPYPSGTAYEVLTAIARRQAGADLPDVFVFRCTEPPLVRIDDPGIEADARAQWNRLRSFFQRWFLSAEGHFRAAFQTFASTDDFEDQLERLLRDWLRQRLARGGVVAWPIATMGSPYPGLRSFGPRHAPVFFGRGRDVARGVEAWSEYGRAGRPFLLVAGASGAGKSSLARAGLVPRLTTPGVVAWVDAWRVAAMRPGGSEAGPVAALAHALMAGAPERGSAEEGQPAALPEIASGDFRTADELASLLDRADAVAIRPVLAALEKIGEEERRAHGFERTVRCDLVLLVDQLDEVFAAATDPEARRLFGRVLGALLDTGRVWIVATLRADLYELFLGEETLFALKGGNATFDLAPPVLADMAEIVRGPARAANLAWEIDPGSREPLDERLIGAIDRPDLLPIIQFTLDRLFQEAESRDGRLTLTHVAYQALGTLDGAIDTAAEAAIAPLGQPAIAALPRLLRALVTSTAAPSGGARATPALREAPRGAVAHDRDSARLVDALTDARVLVSGSDAAGAAVVALAHQRAVEAWTRAREIIAASAELLRVREEIEAARQRWEASGRRSELLIARGLPLSEAENAASALAGELPLEIAAYVTRSGRAARLRQRVVAAAALVFLGVAIAAGALGLLARDQKARAESATAEAETERREAVSARDLADKARRQAESRLRESDLRLAAADELLDNGGKAGELRRCLASTARVAGQSPPPVSRDFFVGRWHVDNGGESTDIDWRQDGTCEARNLFDGTLPMIGVGAAQEVCTWEFQPVSNQEFLIVFRSSRLSQSQPPRMRFRAVTANRIRNVDHGYDAFKVVCPPQEAASERERVGVARARAEARQDDPAARHDLADALQRLGEVLFVQGQFRPALDELTASLDLRLAFLAASRDDRIRQRELSIGYLRVGSALEQLGRSEEALKAYERSSALSERLQSAAPGDRPIRRDLAFAYERAASMWASLGRDKQRAIQGYLKALEIRRDLAQASPDEVDLQTDLVFNLHGLSLLGDPPAVRLALETALVIVERLERDGKLPEAFRGWPSALKAKLANLP